LRDNDDLALSLPAAISTAAPDNDESGLREPLYHDLGWVFLERRKLPSRMPLRGPAFSRDASRRVPAIPMPRGAAHEHDNHYHPHDHLQHHELQHELHELHHDD
jgi:hypothetical protein